MSITNVLTYKALEPKSSSQAPRLEDSKDNRWCSYSEWKLVFVKFCVITIKRIKLLKICHVFVIYESTAAVNDLNWPFDRLLTIWPWNVKQSQGKMRFTELATLLCWQPCCLYNLRTRKLTGRWGVRGRVCLISRVSCCFLAWNDELSQIKLDVRIDLCGLHKYFV